jgi:hypothetical protein
MLREIAEAEIVPWGIAEDAAGAVLAAFLRDECRVVVREDERRLVRWVTLPARTLVAGAEITAGVVARQIMRGLFLEAAEPRPLRS